MKKTESILIAIALVGLILNFFLAPGSGILSVLAFSALAGLYFYLGFALFNEIRLREIFKKGSYTEVSGQKIFIGIFSGIFLASTLIGILFKIQSWPGTRIIQGIGLAGLIIMLVLVLVDTRKSKASFHKNLFRRIFLFGSIGLILFLIPQTTWVEFKYRDHPGYVEAMKAAIADPQNKELWEKVDEEQIIMREND